MANLERELELKQRILDVHKTQATFEEQSILTTQKLYADYNRLEKRARNVAEAIGKAEGNTSAMDKEFEDLLGTMKKIERVSGSLGKMKYGGKGVKELSSMFAAINVEEEKHIKLLLKGKHIDEDISEMLPRLRSWMRDGSRLYLSVPIEHPDKRYHKRRYSWLELASAIAPHFRVHSYSETPGWCLSLKG